jgi:catechol 2,3-dioxygenase-like lactoylglutathione lyase family enzyme
MSSDKKSKTAFRTDGNVAIHVNDLQKAENFYSNVLEFHLISKSENQLTYDTGAIRLYINKDEKLIPFIPALEVQDYKQAKEHLIANGCKIIKEFDGHNALYFTDPFGLTIDIIEKK